MRQTSVTSESITLLVNDVPDEPSRTKYQHAKHLTEAFDTRIICLENVPEQIAVEARKVRSFTGKTMARLYIFFPLWVLYCLLTDDSDGIVVSPHSVLVIEAYLVAVVTGRTLIVDLWDGLSLPEASYESKTALRYRILHRYHILTHRIATRCLKGADLIIASIHPGILTKYGIDKEKVVPLTNGVCDHLFERTDTSTEDRFRVVYLGQANEKRNIDRLMTVVAGADVSAIHIDIVGPTDSVVEATAEDYPEVTLHGQVPHSKALNIVARADVCLCVLPPNVENYHYSYPIKLFEYAALGKPIVASDYTGIRNILTDEENALLVSANSYNDIQREIERLAQNPDLRFRLGYNAKQTAKRYRWSNILDSYAEGINRVMHG